MPPATRAIAIRPSTKKRRLREDPEPPRSNPLDGADLRADAPETDGAVGAPHDRGLAARRHGVVTHEVEGRLVQRRVDRVGARHDRPGRPARLRDVAEGADETGESAFRR